LGCPPASGSGAVVMMKAAEHGDGLDRASKVGSGAFRADRNLLADALVRPSRVEVAQGILGEDIPQVPLRQDDHVVEALAADATQEAFAHRIHQGRPDRGVQDARPDARGDAVEDGSELVVAIADDELRRVPEGRRVANLLRSPRLRGSARHRHLHDALGVHVHDEEGVDGTNQMS